MLSLTSIQSVLRILDIWHIGDTADRAPTPSLHLKGPQACVTVNPLLPVFSLKKEKGQGFEMSYAQKDLFLVSDIESHRKFFYHSIFEYELHQWPC